MSNVNFSGTSSTSANNYRGRYAPSPTGYLHLGNVWTALISWCAAQQNNGRWILRLEDLDRARCQKIYEDAMYEDLHALGFVWEEGPTSAARMDRIANQNVWAFTITSSNSGVSRDKCTLVLVHALVA